eukprot:5902157-Prymnesium_polylepis.2
MSWVERTHMLPSGGGRSKRSMSHHRRGISFGGRVRRAGRRGWRRIVAAVRTSAIVGAAIEESDARADFALRRCCARILIEHALPILSASDGW